MVEKYRKYHGKYILTLVFASIFLTSFGVLIQNVFAETVIDTIQLGTQNPAPQFVGVNPNTNMIYVGQSGGNAISIIDGNTDSVVTTLTIGTNSTFTGTSDPANIAVNPNTNRIYVATSNDGVVVIDGTTNSIVTKISTGGYRVQGIAVNANTNTIYAGVGASVYVIDGLTNNVTTKVSVPDVKDVAVNPVTNMIYATDFHSSTLYVINGTTSSVSGTIPVGSLSWAVAVNPNTNRVYVFSSGSPGNSNSGSGFYVIDGSTNSVITTLSNISAGEIGVNPNTNRVYAVSSAPNIEGIIDGSTNTVIGTVTVGNGNVWSAVNVVTNRIYIVNNNDHSVSVLDGSPASTTSHLTIQSQDNKANPITGFYTVLYQNGNQIGTGFTPASFTLNDSQTYAVHVGDYGKFKFNYWSDTGSTSATRNISITTDDVITAVYKTIPQQPTNLVATAKILKTNLSWNAPRDNGGSAIIGYMVERSTDNGSTWSTLVANTGNNGTTYSDANVSPLKTYTYRVSAINDVGTSDPSNTASATTPTVGPITPPSLP